MLADLGVRVRDLEPDRLGGIEQPIDVAFELEHAAVVGADALEHAVAVQQAVIEDADGRFGGRAPRAADVDEAVGRARDGGAAALIGLVSDGIVKPSCLRPPSVKQANR